ncbi:MAG: hypothetical protein F6K21_07390 [Symploca sp. SIO2D2]|nr:hypothetical protein [Symploca sp. SIO2D2]
MNRKFVRYLNRSRFFISCQHLSTSAADLSSETQGKHLQHLGAGGWR